MRRSARGLAWAGMALVLASGTYWALPPEPRPLAPTALRPPVRGAIHVHTRRSDGTGTLDDVAAAAARAGLQFVVVTDHGDAAREPTPPSYRSGVLVIDAVEVSTEGGHLVAVGLPRTPYPLGGEPRDVVEDVRRFGGVSFAAHPASAKADLRWTDWLAPFDGLEWLNADSEWRDERSWILLRALLTFPFRPAATVASVFDRQHVMLGRWDALTRRRPVVAVAAVDAHARIGPTGIGEPYDSSASLHVPSYETMFRTMSIALPQAALTRDAVRDAATVVGELRAGRVYSTVDAAAGPAAFAFSAASGRHAAVGGEALALDGPVSLRVDVQAPADANISLVRNGLQVVNAAGAALRYEAAPEPAVYRVEVMLPGGPGAPPVPWIVSNPIYVGQAPPRAAPPNSRAAQAAVFLYRDEEAIPTVRAEHSPASQAAVNVTRAVHGHQLLFRYALAGAASASPYAAFALTVPVAGGAGTFDRLTFRARAVHPMRLSVQLRADVNGRLERWHRSVFIGTEPRDMSIMFNDMLPRGPASAHRPVLDRVRDVLFVVETTNARPGTNGQVFLDDVRFER